MVKAETDVGISQFLANHPGFRCVFKHRYADFIVREIDVNGNMAKLTSTDYKAPLPDTEATPTEDVTPADAKEHLKDLLGSQQKLDEISQTVEELRKGQEGPDGDGYTTVWNELDKNKRKDIHQSLRSCFNGTETTTIDGKDGEKFIQIRLSSSRPNKRRRRGVNEPPRFRGWLSFVLYKENTDTTDAVAILAKLLRIPPGAFTFAGTKDRRAVTTQNVRVKGIAPTRMAGVNKALRSRVRVGNFSTSDDRPLRMGELKGNSFTIVLRDIQEDRSDEEIQTSISNLIETGFINYFGLQRFGSGVHGTHEIGFSVLKGDFETAIRQIIDPIQVEEDETRPDKVEGRKNTVEALKGYLNGSKSAAEALKQLPPYRNIERMILESYSKPDPGCSTNHQGAFMALPRNLRTLYTHAAQSFLFNIMATRRASLISDVQRGAIEGDLILTEGDKRDFEATSPTNVPKVRLVSAVEAASNTLSLEKVVLPVVGTTTILPNNVVGELASTTMEKYGMKLEQGAAKNFGVPGDYRHFLARPEIVSSEIVRYAHEDDPLVETDLMAMEGVKSATESGSEKCLRGLRMEFTLRASQYATMCLRELTKQDSSSFGGKLGKSQEANN